MARAAEQRIIMQAGPEETRIEGLAAEAGIGPGDLLEHNAALGFLRHNVTTGPILPIMVATETQHPDDEDNVTIDIDYANADTMYAWIPKSGDIALLWLNAGETTAVGDYMISDGDGALLVEAAVDATDVTMSIVGRAMEIVAAGGALARVLIEIR